MVNKVELGTLTQVSNNEHNFLKALNQNFTALQKAINDTLSRSGVTPNEMNEVLDMNGKRVINIGRAIEATDAVTKQDIQDIIDAAQAAIAGIDQIIVAAKAAVEAYAQEYIYPVAQAALDGAVAAKEAAEAARDALLEDEGYQKLIENLDELVELADHAEELQAIIDNIDELLAVAEDIEDIKSVAENLSGLKSIVDNMQEILQASTYASQAAASASTASTAASTATSAASTATTKASEASASATSAAGSATTATGAATTASGSATEAATSASAASTAASTASSEAVKAATWAEGDDEAVEALGGEHSAKGWAEEAAQTVEGKQDKLTSANAGDNVTITEVSGVVKINAEAGVEVITVTGESGTLTAEQIAKINEGCAIVCDGEVFRLSDESSTLSYKTFINSNAANTETMSFKAIYVQLSQGTVNYGRWTKEPVPVSSGPTYSAGANIQISADNVISATDTTYTAGTGIEINNGVISATGGDIETYNSLSEAQRTTILSTGKYHNVDVVNGTIFETYQGKFEQFTKTASGATFSWSSATMPSSATWQNVAYGNGVFVAVAADSTKAAYSTDGINWTASTLPSSTTWANVAYGNGKFVAIAYGSSTAAYSTDGINWTATTLSRSSYWRDIAYGNGKFVAVSGSDPFAAYSADGISWSDTRLTPGSGTWSVCYGNNKFIAMLSSGTTVASSTDGVSWTYTTVPSVGSLNALAYGNGVYVLVGDSSNVRYSTDGTNWAQATLPSSAHLEDVAYGNGVFVATSGGSTSTAFYSIDGISWTQTTMSSSANWTGITYGNNKFVTVAYNSNTTAVGAVTTSYTYSLTDLNADHLKNNSTASQALAIGTSATATATRSIAVGPTAAAEGTNSLALGYAAMAGRTASGTVTASTYDIAIGPMSTATAASYGTAIGYSSQSSGQYGTAIGASARATAARAVGIGYSARAQAENAVQIGQGNNSTAGTLQFRSYPLVDADGKIVADRIGSIPAYNSLSNLQRTTLLSSGTYGGADVVNGTIFTTEPGKFEQFSKTVTSLSMSFTDYALPKTDTTSSIAYCEGKYVAFFYGPRTDYLYSTNGTTWTQGTFPTSFWGYSVVSGHGKFVAIPQNGTTAYYSTDAINWTSTSLQEIVYPQKISFVNGWFVVVGQDNWYNTVINYSNNGTTWTSATGPTNVSLKQIAYGNGMYIAGAGGSTSDIGKIYKSTNLTTWTLSNTGVPSRGYNCVCFDGDKFVAMGASNPEGLSVITSTDGTTWTEVYTNNDIMSISELVYGNGVFYASSNTTGGRYVVSADGTHWTASAATSGGRDVAGRSVFDGTHFITWGSRAFVGTPVITYDYALTALSYDKTTTDTLLAAKQGTLTAGTNITIDENNVISATGGGSTPTYDPATRTITL